MSGAGIRNVGKLADLQDELGRFSGIALRSLDEFDATLNGLYQEMQQVREQWKQAVENCREDYRQAKDDYDECRREAYENQDDDGGMADCSYEKERCQDAYDELQRAKSNYSTCGDLCAKADDWLRAYQRNSRNFRTLAGATTQESIRFLNAIRDLVQKYILAADYPEVREPSGAAGGGTGAGTEARPVSGSSYAEDPSVIVEKLNINGAAFEVKSREHTDSLGNRFSTYHFGDTGPEGKSFISMRVNHQSKSAVITDIRTDDTSLDAFFNVDQESFVLIEMEKRARFQGCREVISFASNDTLHFFERNGYEVMSRLEKGAEIYKKI